MQVELNPCDVDHEVFNAFCGDYLHLTMRLNDKRMRSLTIAWEGEGLHVISQASASILSEHIINKTTSLRSKI